MKDIPISEARQNFPELSSDVHYRKRRLLITKHGEQWVALVPVEDLEVLQAFEDHIDLDDARKALADVRKSGTVPWKKIKQRLKL